MELALVGADGEVLYKRNNNVREHSSHLFSYIRELLFEKSMALNDIKHLYVLAGPGSFTGIRVSVSAFEGLSFGLGAPLHKVSALDALSSENAYELCLIDARRKAYYASLYRSGQVLSKPFEIHEDYFYSERSILQYLQDHFPDIELDKALTIRCAFPSDKDFMSEYSPLESLVSKILKHKNIPEIENAMYIRSSDAKKKENV